METGYATEWHALTGEFFFWGGGIKHVVPLWEYWPPHLPQSPPLSAPTQIMLQEKLSGAFKYRQNRLSAGTPLRTPLGELAALPQTF